MTATTPSVSIVIPTFNRLARLRRVLAALAKQTYPHESFEVVVVSDGSSDGTDEYMRDADLDLNVVFVSQPNSGPAVARNHGVQMATGELVLFVDDDVIAIPDLVEQHVEARRGAPEPVVVIGPMLTPPDFEMSQWVRWEQTMLYKQYRAMAEGQWKPSFRQFYTGNASVPRASLLAVGGFDPRFRRGEDVELALRLAEMGVQFQFCPEAIGYHYAERPYASWLRNAHDYGVNDVVFSRDGDRAWMLSVISGEFQRRHVLSRWMTRVCVAQPRLESLMQTLLRGVATAGNAVHVEKPARFALSGIYNVSYYQGLAGELGGAQAFRRVIVAPEGGSA